MTALDPLGRLRELCLSLPEATERISHGEPSWFVRKAPKTLVAQLDHDRPRR